MSFTGRSAEAALLAIVALSMACCGPSVSGVSGVAVPGNLNEGAKGLMAQIEANTLSCGTKRRVGVEYQSSPTSPWREPGLFEIEGLSFEVGDNQATPADIRNGTTFIGEVIFSESSIAREFDLESSTWSDWGGPTDDNSSYSPHTYLLTERDGNWDLSVQGNTMRAVNLFGVAAQLLANNDDEHVVRRGGACFRPLS